MTIDKAEALIKMHIDLGNGYNRHAVRLVLTDVMRDHSQIEVDALIAKYQLDALWQIRLGTRFKTD